jgi:hypothetical protein
MEEKAYGLRITRENNTIGEIRFDSEQETLEAYYRISKDPLYIELQVQAWIVYPPAKPVKSGTFVEPLVTFGGY